MDGALRRGVGDHVDAQGVQQGAHQRAHPAVFDQVIEVLQGKAGPQGSLIQPQLGADAPKVPRGVRLHQLLGLPDQQDHGPRRGLGVDDADLLLRMLLQYHLPPQDGGVVGAGKVGGNGEADGLISLFKGAGKGRRRGTGRGGGSLLVGHGSQHHRDLQQVVIHKFLAAHLNTQGDQFKRHLIAGKVLRPQVAAAVADDVPNHISLLVIWYLILYLYHTSVCPVCQ